MGKDRQIAGHLSWPEWVKVDEPIGNVRAHSLHHNTHREIPISSSLGSLWQTVHKWYHQEAVPAQYRDKYEQHINPIIFTAHYVNSSWGNIHY